MKKLLLLIVAIPLGAVGPSIIIEFFFAGMNILGEPNQAERLKAVILFAIYVLLVLLFCFLLLKKREDKRNKLWYICLGFVLYGISFYLGTQLGKQLLPTFTGWI